MMEPQTELIAAFPFSGRGGIPHETRVELVSQPSGKGSRFVQLRQYVADGPEYRPLGRPLYVRREGLPDFIAALEEARDVLDREDAAWRRANVW